MKIKKLTILRHFKPNIDKSKPVAEWELNEEGKESMQKVLDEDIFKDINKIISSVEGKAKITAFAISKKYSIPVEESEEIAEVDRSKVGFIEGDYADAVRQYLTESEEFKYRWEDISEVRKRVRSFIQKLENEEENVLVISHGMLLSIMLSKYFEENIIEYWRSLTMGKIIEVDPQKLIDVWKD